MVALEVFPFECDSIRSFASVVSSTVKYHRSSSKTNPTFCFMSPEKNTSKWSLFSKTASRPDFSFRVTMPFDFPHSCEEMKSTI